MIRFARLYRQLDSTTKTNAKIAAMVDYFGDAPPADAAWAIYFLSGNKLRRLVATKQLRIWAAQQAGIPLWLVEESYHAVGDLAETISLVVPPGKMTDNLSLAHWVTEKMQPLRGLDEDQQQAAVVAMWNQTPADVRLVMMKLITGAFRVGVSRRLVTRAIAECSGIAAEVIAHRLMGDWQPTADAFAALIDADIEDTSVSQPYPFCLAYPIDHATGPSVLGPASEYLVEWKWDGIRGQVIRRDQQTFVWSRGEELMERRWPEIESASERLPGGTVIDGEILATDADGRVLPFGQLQRRIGRKKVGKKLLSEVPVVFHAFDLLEHGGTDIRSEPLAKRREWLESLLDQVDHPTFRTTELVAADSWDRWQTIRETSRQHNAEGFMIKSKQAAYDVGRVRGTWWKWKVDPYTIDAVLIYAQKGHGRRANLFTDYTFALWQDNQLVPFAKAYSGLADDEIRKVDRFVRDHTTESFGPVRSVTPELVMELAFEGIQRSKRHKSGVATRFPRIVRWRHDKKPADANRLSDLLQWLPQE